MAHLHIIIPHGWHSSNSKNNRVCLRFYYFSPFSVFNYKIVHMLNYLCSVQQTRQKLIPHNWFGKYLCSEVFISLCTLISSNTRKLCFSFRTSQDGLCHAKFSNIVRRKYVWKCAKNPEDSCDFHVEHHSMKCPKPHISMLHHQIVDYVKCREIKLCNKHNLILFLSQFLNKLDTRSWSKKAASAISLCTTSHDFIHIVCSLIKLK